MKSICVLGNGQLGRMLRQAGEKLGISVYPVGIYDNLDSLPYQHSIITAEIEHWPETPLTCELASQPNFINREIFPQIADRLLQKKFLDSLSLTTAPWKPLTSNTKWPKLFTELGNVLMIKCRTGGYDGRGQWRITPNNVLTLPPNIYGTTIVEQTINFSGEVSLIGARKINGQCFFYPLTYNLHQDGILRASIAYPEPDQKYQVQAELMLSSIMEALNYVGVMTMECFLVKNKLLINELAPRVHNSGHWTQNGASISQFELHLRAILDMPITTPNIATPTIMINLIGTAFNPAWLSLPLVDIYWYEKKIRPTRKVGHINLSSANWSAIKQSLNKLQILLPHEYHASITWIKKQCTSRLLYDT